MSWHLERALSLTQHFPPVVCYRQACRLLGREHMARDEWRTATLLSEGAAVTLRHQLLISLHKQIRSVGDVRNSLWFYDNYCKLVLGCVLRVCVVWWWGHMHMHLQLTVRIRSGKCFRGCVSRDPTSQTNWSLWRWVLTEWPWFTFTFTPFPSRNSWSYGKCNCLINDIQNRCLHMAASTNSMTFM